MSSDPYPYVIAFDPAITVKNGESLTIPYTITTTTTNYPIIGTNKSSGQLTVSGTGGTWTGAIFGDSPPDMTDWPADDIIDWFAKDLAKRHPA